MNAKQYHSLPNGTRVVYLTDAPATRGELAGLTKCEGTVKRTGDCTSRGDAYSYNRFMPDGQTKSLDIHPNCLHTVKAAAAIEAAQ